MKMGSGEMKASTFRNLLASGIAMVASVGWGAAETGNCPQKAALLTLTESDKTESPSLKREWDVYGGDDEKGAWMEDWDSSWDPDSKGGVYYYKFTLPRGAKATISAKSLSVDYDCDISVDPDESYGEMDLTTPEFEQITEGENDYYILKPSAWDESDLSSCQFIISLSGTYQKQVVLHYQLGLAIAEGTSDNPEELTVGKTGERDVATLPDGATEWQFSAFLESGRKYIFLTSGGTEGSVNSLFLSPTGDITGDDYSEYDYGPDEFNQGVAVVMKRAGRMNFEVTPQSGRFGFSFTLVQPRPVEEHDWFPLVLGKDSAPFAPGRMNERRSIWFDDIIDNRLFRIEATGGMKYYARTSGASAPIRMILYDAKGTVLAENDGLAADDLNAALAFVASSSAPYYLGVCADIDDEMGEVPAQEVTLSLSALTDEGLDQWDPGDDIYAGATILAPVPERSGLVKPSEADPVGGGAHSFSSSDWVDWYSLPGRAGFTYRISASSQTADSWTTLRADVLQVKVIDNLFFTETNLITVASGDLISVGTEHELSFPATENANYLVRVRPLDHNGHESPGLQLRSYVVHSCFTSADGAGFGLLKVDARGLARGKTGTWRLDGSGECEYPYGSEIPLSVGTYAVKADPVDGFSPDRASQSVQVSAAQETACEVVFGDVYDGGDETRDGNKVKVLSFGKEKQFEYRTLWAKDEGDWMSFDALAGTHYEISFADKSGTSWLSVHDADGAMLVSSDTGVSFVPAADGRHYLHVEHDPVKVDEGGSYSLMYYSVKVGTVRFADVGFRARDDEPFARFAVVRDSSEGAIRVKWATYAETAEPGVDYVPAEGVLVWGDGEVGEKIGEIKLIPPLNGALKGDRTLRIRLDVLSEDELGDGEYQPLLVGAQAAEMTISDGERRHVDPISPAIAPTEQPGTQVAYGTFAGVLREVTGCFETNAVRNLARLSLCAEASGSVSATIEIAGTEYTLTGRYGDVAEGEMSAELTSDEIVVDGIAYSNEMKVVVSSGTIGGLTPGVAAVASVELVLRSPSDDGLTVDEAWYSGESFRMETVRSAAAQDALKPAFGRYTIALPSEGVDIGAPLGSGYLSLELGATGTVSAVGALADGTPLSFTTFAAVADSWTGEGVDVRLPFYFRQGTKAFGGILRLMPTESGYVVTVVDESDILFWCDDDPHATVWGDVGFQMAIWPTGGWFDRESSLQALLCGYELNLSAEGTDADGLALSVEGDDLLPESTLMRIRSFDRDSGLLSGSIGADDFSGICLLSHEEDDPLADVLVAGYCFREVDAEECLSNSVSVAVIATEADPDWTESWDRMTEVGFAAAGGAVEGLPDPLYGLPGDVVDIPEVDTNRFVRGGYDFIGWSVGDSTVYNSGDEYVIPLTNAVLTACWRMSVTGIAEALVAAGEGIEFEAFGDAPWFPQPAVSHTGEIPSVQSGPRMFAGSVSGLSAILPGSGHVSFWWRCNADDSFLNLGQEDKVTFLVNGAVQKTLSGVKPWEKVDLDLAEVSNVLTWVYHHTGSVTNGVDAAWLSELSFGQTYQVYFDPGAGTCPERYRTCVEGAEIGKLPEPVRSGWKYGGWTNEMGVCATERMRVPKGGMTLFAKWDPLPVTVSFDGNGATSGNVPGPIPSYSGETIELPRVILERSADYDFAGWDLNGETYLPGSMSKPLDGDTVFVAQWTDVRIKKALKTDLDISARGWDVSSRDGLPCVVAAVKTSGGTAEISTTVEGAGTVSFRWALDMTEDMMGASPNDRIELYVGSDPAPVRSLTAANGWKDEEYEIEGSGSHTLRWVFTCSTEGVFISTYGRGWLDTIQWTPAGRKVRLTFDSNGGECAESYRDVVTNSVLKNLPTPILSGKGFLGWYAGDVYVDGATFRIGEEDLTVLAHWGDLPVTVRFDAGGATGSVPDELVTPGADWRLPTAEGLSWDDGVHEFRGWSDGQGIYGAGEKYVVSTAMTFVASWRNVRYSRPLDCDGLEFSSSSDSVWVEVSDATAQNGSCVNLKSESVGLGSGVEITSTAAEDGTVEFNWSLVRGADFFGSLDDRWEFWIGDVLVESLADGDFPQWTSSAKAWKVSKGQTMTWRFRKHESEMFIQQEPVARLDFVRWTPDVKDVAFTVVWEAGSTAYPDGVRSVYCVVGSTTNFLAKSGDGISVEPNTVVRLGAELEDWHGATGTGEYTVTESTSVSLSAESVDPTDIAISELPSAEIKRQLRLDTSAFDAATEAETKIGIAKVVGWAEKYGYSVAQVNALRFPGGNPEGDEATAYLFNTDVAGLDEAKVGFRFVRFDPANPPTADDFKDAGYNGVVHIFKSRTLDPWEDIEATETVDAPAMFYRAKLMLK